MKYLKAFLCAVLTLMNISISAASGYPDRSVHIVVGYPPGGGSDSLARLCAQILSEKLGQSFIVDNRPGAAGNIAANYVARENDPYKLLFVGGAHVINASLYDDIPYRPIQDFAPVGLVATSANVIAARPGLDVKNLKELMALAKSAPDQMTYASPGIGTPMHLAMELFISMSDIKLLHIPYAGVQSITATIGAQTDLLTMSLPSVLPYVNAGKLVALGVTGPEQSPLMPDVPTVAESASLPGYQALAWFGLLAPASASPSMVETLNHALNEALQTDEVRAKLIALGFEPARTTPDEFKTYMSEEMVKWENVVKSANVKAQ